MVNLVDDRMANHPQSYANCQPDCKDYLTHNLEYEIRNRLAVFWMGVGGSLAMCGGDSRAGWPGFLDYGQKRLRDLGLLDDVAKGAHFLKTGSVSAMLAAGDEIQSVLRQKGEWETFLRDFRNSLRLRDSALGKALAALDLPICTCAYDDLLEQATGFGSTSWAHPEQVERALRRECRDIVHVHGIWNEPDSIVLGRDSYRRYLRNERAQATLRALCLLRSQVFIGFGAGLSDPHFDRLRRWARRLAPSGSFRHYRLCTQKEAESLRAEHRQDRIYAVVYGRRHSDLPGFLRRLAPEPASRPARSKWRWAAALAATGLLAAQQAGDLVPSSTARVEGSVLLGGAPAGSVQVALPGYPRPLDADAWGRFAARLEAGPEATVWIQHGGETIAFHPNLPRRARTASLRFHLESGACELAGWR